MSKQCKLLSVTSREEINGLRSQKTIYIEYHVFMYQCHYQKVMSGHISYTVPFVDYRNSTVNRWLLVSRWEVTRLSVTLGGHWTDKSGRNNKVPLINMCRKRRDKAGAERGVFIIRINIDVLHTAKGSSWDVPKQPRSVCSTSLHVSYLQFLRSCSTFFSWLKFCYVVGSRVRVSRKSTCVPLFPPHMERGESQISL